MFLRKIIYITGFVLLFLGILGYGIYKALPLILGPQIEIFSPQNGELVEGKIVTIRGQVFRVQKLFINEIATNFSQSGLFETYLGVYQGNNLIKIIAFDRFGRSVSKTLLIGGKNR